MIINKLTKNWRASCFPISLFLLIILFFPMPAASQMPGYAEELVREAAIRKLHEERGWRALLHYAKSFNGTQRSKIDDTRFFLSPDGRIDAKAELEATLRSFFIEETADGLSSSCRFPARYAWLVDKLQIKKAELPAAACSERDDALGAIEADSAVLVFPVGHINSPASMFGHTLIRIDGSSKSNLISYAVNYSAANTDSNGLSYAWKGLTGMYKGYFSLMPYYDKVREYNDLEHRDIWEYRLNLTPPEVKRMLDHIWELQNIESSYYFLDENCSYNLLFLIEVARPELTLTDNTGIFVLPSDTVQAVMNKLIVKEIKYRPSQGTRIRKIISLLDIDGQKIAHDISLLKESPASVKNIPATTVEKIKILDMAAGYVQFRYSRKEMEKETYSRLYLKILGERSRLGAAPDDLYLLTEPARPDEGHGTTKISVAGGVRAGKLFGELNVRPQFHALLDPDQGYLPGAQIMFLNTALRYVEGAASPHLQSLHIIDIISIAPRDTFFKPVSWKINTGFDRETLSDGKEHLIYRLNSGGGFSYTSPLGGIWYFMGELDVNVGSKFRAGATAAPGLSIGATGQLSEGAKILFNMAAYRYAIGDARSSLKTGLALNQRIARNNSLSVETSGELMNSHRLYEMALRWNYYY